MKRFYKNASVEQAEGLYYIHLDGRAVRCPSGAMLTTPSEALAQELQKEWAAQEENIIPDTMPLTQILTTQIDRVGQERAAMQESLFKYLDTDLLCYRCGDEPPGQAAAQSTSWDPWLRWFSMRYDADLKTTNDIVALKQSASAHDAVKNNVQYMDDAYFTVIQLVTSLSGSLVLGLAFVEKAISAKAVFDAAHVEEDFKAQIYDRDKYGLDPMEQKKDDAMMRDLEAAEIFLKLL